MNNKVLIDSGIWIQFLNGKSKTKKLINLLEQNIAVTHTWIEGELRVGYIKEREFFLDSLKSLEYLPELNSPELFSLIEKEKFFGKGLSIIDLHLYFSAIKTNSYIWTNDKNLRSICDKIGILFSI